MYDSSVPVGKLLGIVEAVPFVALSIGDVHISEEMTVCFVREDDADDQSALSHQLRSYFDTNCDSAAFVSSDLLVDVHTTHAAFLGAWMSRGVHARGKEEKL